MQKMSKLASTSPCKLWKKFGHIFCTRHFSKKSNRQHQFAKTGSEAFWPVQVVWLIKGHPFMTSTKNRIFDPPPPPSTCVHVGLTPPLLWTSTCRRDLNALVYIKTAHNDLPCPCSRIMDGPRNPKLKRHLINVSACKLHINFVYFYFYFFIFTRKIFDSAACLHATCFNTNLSNLISYILPRYHTYTSN